MSVMDENGILVLALIALVAVSAFFSASETAYTSLNRARLKNMANGGDRRAEKALALSEDYDRLLSGILVGNNIVNILSASLATVLFVRLLGGGGVSVSTAVMTVVVLMFGEIAPKSIAKERPEKVALAFYPALSAILFVLSPIIFLTTCWQKLVYTVFKPAEDRGITEEELITIVEEAENEGEIDEHESELIRSAIEFNDLTTIVGILHEKDFYRLREKASLAQMMTEPLCVVPSTQIAVLLKLLQRTKNHMAVVVDEYGGVMGIVTMEDILEELVGEIWDEHDEVTQDIVRLSDAQWRVSGSASLDDLRELFPIDDDFDSVTVNGWVLELLGHFPQPEDTFEYKDLRVTVEKVTRRRVEQIRIERKPENT